MRHIFTWISCLLLAAGCGTTPKKADEKLTGGGDTKVAEVVKPKPPDINEEAREAFDIAVDSYRDQKKSGRFDYNSLLASFETALDKDPKLAEAHYNLGCIYEAMHDDKKAEEHYRKALEIRGDLAPAAANWGSLLWRKGKADQALLVYKRALSKEEKNSAVLLNMAAIYQNQKKYDQALKTASDVLIRDPGNVGAYRIMASVYLARDDLDMAHLICLRGLVVKEKDPRLMNTLGLVLLKLKRVPEALAQFRGALEQAPDMVPTRFNVAKIALDYKDFRVAKDEFSKILEYEPENKKAAVGLGIALKGAGDFEGAKAHFEALANRYEKMALPHYWIAVMELRNFNNLNGAEKEFKTFIKMAGSRLSSDHQAFKYLAEIKMSRQAETKMKAMEKKMQEDAKREAEFQKKLAEQRVKLFEDAWAKAEKEGDVLPPSKLNAKELPFVLIPPAVEPTKKTKVALVGMVFKNIKTVEIGTLKAKWRQVNKTTLEMIVPKGLGLGAWDVMVTFKDKNEDPMLFVGGLWVGKKPKQKPKPKEEKKPKKAKDAEAKDKGIEKKETTEPGKEKGVIEGEPGQTGKKKAGDTTGEKAKEKEPDEPQEPGEPDEPGEAGEPSP